MGFSTGTSSTLPNFITSFLSFATTNGWTQDENDSGNGHVAFHRGSSGSGVWASMRYDTADAQVLSLHHALDFDGAGTDPGNHTDDSGNGVNSSWSNATARGQRHVDLEGTGPYNYWLFEDTTPAPYLYAVIEISSGQFVHMHFGELVKDGTWTGGGFVCGFERLGNLDSIQSTGLLDGLFSQSGNTGRKAATLHMEGFPEQDAAGKWGQVWGASMGTAAPDDTAGEDKVHVQGGFRGGPTAYAYGNNNGFSNDNGQVNGYPIECYYRQPTTAATRYLGSMPNVRGINNRFFSAAQAITIGSDTWYVFPWSAKSGTLVSAPNSGHSGIMYKATS